jgi:predicted MFS family arabinose efflux permease
MSGACGVCVANVYYNQPLLGFFSAYFHAVPWESGFVATAAQIGYGLGLFFFLPLGDLIERRRLILMLISGCAISLVAMALAPNLPFLIVAQFFVALTAISAQILIPLGVDLVPENQRGRLVGALMSGLLCGILLARVFSGFISDFFGWRILYGMAAALMLVTGVSLRFNLPRRPPALKISYAALMRSTLELLGQHPQLIKVSLVSALSFATFSAFWVTLSFLMTDHFHRSATETGLFGIVGLVGAAAAPWAGHLSDRRGSSFTIGIALVLMLLSYVVMGVWVSLPALVIGVLLMDLGAQSVQVAAQSQVISLLPSARSRLNTLYMVARFGGGALGSVLGATIWSSHQWPGVCLFCIATSVLAITLQIVPRKTPSLAN